MDMVTLAIIIIFFRGVMSEAGVSRYLCEFSDKDLAGCSGALKYHCKNVKNGHAEDGCYVPVRCQEGEGFDFRTLPNGTLYPTCAPCKGNETNPQPCWTNKPHCVCSPMRTCSDRTVVPLKPGNSTHQPLCGCNHLRGYYHPGDPNYTCPFDLCECAHKICEENEVLSATGDCVAKTPNVTPTTLPPSTTTPLPSLSSPDHDTEGNTTEANGKPENTTKTLEIVIPITIIIFLGILIVIVLIWYKKCYRSRSNQAKSNGIISPPQGSGSELRNGSSTHHTTSEQDDPASGPFQPKSPAPEESPHHVVIEQEDLSNVPLLLSSPAPEGQDIPCSWPPLPDDGPPHTQEQSIHSPGSEQSAAPRPVLTDPAEAEGVNIGSIHHGNRIVTVNIYNFGTAKPNRMPHETEESWSDNNIADDRSISDSEDDVNAAEDGNSGTRLGEIPRETMDTDSAGVSLLRPEPEGQSTDIGQHTEPTTVWSSRNDEGQHTEPKTVWSSRDDEGQQTEPKTVWSSRNDEGQQTEPKTVWSPRNDEGQQTEPSTVLSSTCDEHQITEPKVSFTRG